MLRHSAGERMLIVSQLVIVGAFCPVLSYRRNCNNPTSFPGLFPFGGLAQKGKTLETRLVITESLGELSPKRAKHIGHKKPFPISLQETWRF